MSSSLHTAIYWSVGSIRSSRYKLNVCLIHSNRSRYPEYNGSGPSLTSIEIPLLGWTFRLIPKLSGPSYLKLVSWTSPNIHYWCVGLVPGNYFGCVENVFLGPVPDIIIVTGTSPRELFWVSGTSPREQSGPWIIMWIDASTYINLMLCFFLLSGWLLSVNICFEELIECSHILTHHPPPTV